MNIFMPNAFGSWKVKEVFDHNKNLSSLFKYLCHSCLNWYDDDEEEPKPPDDLHGFDVEFFSFNPLYRLLFLLCSILSLGFSGFFYCGCVLYVFLRNDVLTQVLSAVKRSGKRL